MKQTKVKKTRINEDIKQTKTKNNKDKGRQQGQDINETKQRDYTNIEKNKDKTTTKTIEQNKETAR
jgi:hypothetical protein